MEKNHAIDQSLNRRITVFEDSKESQSKFRQILPPGVKMQMITAAPFFDKRIEKVITKFNPDLIILDMSLAECSDSGFRVLRQLKKSKVLKSIPAVICSKSISHDPNDKYRRMAKSLGAVEALPKLPFPGLDILLSFANPKERLVEMQAEVY